MNISGAKIVEPIFARHERLSLLGIMPWYSRYKLPNAGKTPEVLYVCADSAKEGGQDSRPRLVEADRIDNPHLQAVDKGKSGLDMVAEQLRPSALDVSMLDAKNETGLLELGVLDSVQEISLCMVALGKGLIFYEGQAPGLQKQELSFIKAFLKYVIDELSDSFESSFFEWPVFSSAVLRLDQNRFFNEAISRWATKADWASVQYVFYFGYHFDVMEQCLLDIKIASDSECVFVPIKISIAELLGAPIKKRGLWESISTLSRK